MSKKKVVIPVKIAGKRCSLATEIVSKNIPLLLSKDAMKKAGRETSEGVIQSYIHAGNKIGAMVELKCETDFVARTEEFIELTKDLAMQVAAMSPNYIYSEDEGAEKLVTAK